MSWFSRLAVLASIAVLVVWATTRQTDAQMPPPEHAFVHNGFVRVIDGDTVEIWKADRRWGIGLLGIDAPEGNTACGQSAAARMWELTAGGAKFRAEEITSEKYRLMYHAETMDDRSIEEILVSEGLAKVDRGGGKEGAQLKKLEREAQRENRGCVWGGKKGPRPTERKFPERRESRFLEDESIQNPEVPHEEHDGVTTADQGVFEVTGFQDRLVAGGFTEPTTFEFAPDGRIFVAEKDGRIRLVKDGAVVTTPVLDIRNRVNAYWDHGLIGLALDPDFASNGFIYVTYTFENNPAAFSGTKMGRVSRFTVVGDTASPSSEVVLVGKVTLNLSPNQDTCDDFPVGADCIPSDGASHSVGNLRFGNDGKLYATFGDAASFVEVDDEALRAQNFDWLSGKVIRINQDGTAPLDNPFWNGNLNSNRSKVFAYGVRNAFRFNFEPTRGTLYLGDVGWNDGEEISVVRAGSNLGWPCYEGSSVQAGYASKSVCQTLYSQGSGAHTGPIEDWAHNEGGCCGAAAVGGAFATSYSTPYDNAYFYADYSKNWIRYFKVDANDNIVGGVHDFMQDTNGPVSLQRGATGAIYYLAINTGEIRHIQQGSGNQPPVAAISATPTDGLAPIDVSFSAAGSTDPNLDGLTYTWDYGDGQQGSGLTTAHQYTTNGTYTATLTVRDTPGLTDTATIVVTVGNRSPSVEITSPANESTYVVGQTINLEAEGTDPDDGGSLPSDAFTWKFTVFHNTHSHPGFLTLTGASASFTIPDHGDNSYVFIELEGVDSAGLTKTTSVTIRPQTLQFTLDSSPPGLQLVYDGVLMTAPFTVTTVANSSHTIEAPTPQGNALFVNWSDGGSAQHNVTLGTANESRLATYRLASSITFNELSNPNRNFSGTYPAGVATWPSGQWYLSGPWGDLPTNSMSFQNGSQTSGTFSFASPKVLLSARVYNGGGGSSTVTLACAGNPTRSQVLSAGQSTVISTNWTAPCTTVTASSSNGWDTNFDDFVYDSSSAPDTTAPTISAVQATAVAQNGATITWTTNEASSTQVEYGTTTAYGSFAPATPNTSPVTAHSQALSGLTAGTLYHYRVLSRDAAGNLATSSDFTFTTTAADTTAPVISAVQSGGVTQTGATITWTTNEASSTQVEYGTTTAYGSFAPPAPNTSPVTAHSQALSGLIAGTLYHYRVLSRDAAGNLATSDDFTFTTTAADTTAPVISVVQSGGVTQTGATITWTTNEASSTQVEYGTTTAYGSFAPPAPNTSPVTAHSQALSGLTTGTPYHYRVLSRDAAGNLATSDDFTFTTLADTTAPAISAVQAAGISQTAATITWTTDEAASTQVEYGTTTAYGSFAPVTPNTSPMTAHSQALTGLTAGTLYNYRVLSRDPAGNLATSANFTFTTASNLGSAWQFDGSNDRATASDSNSLDLTGPLTLEAWVRFDAVTPGKWHTIIFKQGLANNLAYALYYKDGIWFELKSGSNTYTVLQDFQPRQTGIWYHIAGVYDGSTMRIFVNGQQTASRSFSGTVSTSTFALTLGYNNVWSDEQLAGTIDEVRISDSARYTSSFTPSGAFTPDANTRALWHFDEGGTGQTTADASGNGNTLRRGANTNAESSDPAWVAGSPLLLLGLLPRRRTKRPKETL